MPKTAVVWLRNDLRLADNPALRAAFGTGHRVVAVYVEETDKRLRHRGAASRWWLHHSLNALAEDLAGIGVRLETQRGDGLEVIRGYSPEAVFWNRRYAAAEREVDTEIKDALKRDGVEAVSLPGNVLVEPFDIATKSGGPYAVYSPFWNAVRERDIPAPTPSPRKHHEAIKPRAVDTDYVPEAWTRKLTQYWKVGEAAAKRRLVAFLDRIGDYPDGRDYPAHEATSKLSPHLAFGEISPRQVWHAASALAEREPSQAGAVRKFLMELTWRDFNYHQLYHRLDIATVPMQRKFDKLQWRDAKSELRAWQKGETGIPIIDAGMKELWETGFMQNRVRMLVASLLTKNLLLDWRLGEQWFWDCLVDADIANNPANWQWVAGCGNDAAPYFRIFNPNTQAEKFDSDGAYVRRWAPEPREPIVDLKRSRERALEAFKAL